MKRYWIYLFLCCFGPKVAQSQQFSAAATQWNDSFVAWEIFGLAPVEGDTTGTEWEEVLIGTVKQRWLDVREDWTEWDFTLNGKDGTIKQKWKSDPSQWELRTYEGAIITMKTIWPDDVTNWRITDNTDSYDLKSRYTTDLGEWNVKAGDAGTLKIEVTYTNDPRDWTLTDALSEAVTPEMKLAMLFTVLFHAAPHR